VSSRQSSGGNTSSGAIPSGTLEQQVLAANPILEAFGNAKTLRNNNSSRFGKLITINFDQGGTITGGGIINYLLEKSRVVGPSPGERNYHIFYQLLSAAETDPTLTQELKLQNAELFHYTCESIVTIEGVSDEKDFEDTCSALNILRFSESDKKEIFRLVAGVLHFGNIKFKLEKKATEEDSAYIANPEQVSHASALWGVNPKSIEKFLCNRYIGTHERILVSYNMQQASDARDAMTKRVYADLFQIVVDKINYELGNRHMARQRFIGVLDIFGFESFAVNSFEQLCINYCNEKLQFHFNEHIFKMEQALYQAEGIHIPGTAFVDNQPTLDLLEAKAVGIFSMIDEEINVPRGSDEGFLQKVLTKFADGKHPNCLRPNVRDVKDFLKNFGVLHYAGPVFYNVTNFLEKNKDQLHADIVGLLRESSSPYIKKMFPPEEPSRGPTKGAKLKTLGGQFKTQLTDLIDTLNTTFPHFVRCLKPNDDKLPNLFKAGRMQDQLRYAGLLEVCRIRKLGYPVRRPFDEFYRRYRCCDLTSPDLDSLLAALVRKGVLIKGEFAKGLSRVFMRTQQSFDLEMAREAALLQVAVLLQRMGRGMVCRLKYKNYKKIIINVKEAVRRREESVLASALEMSFELPWGGSHLPLIQQAKALLARVREENKVIGLLQSAIAAKELNSLKSAVSAAYSMNPPFQCNLVFEAQAIIERLEAELATKNALIQAINSRDLKALSQAIAQAESLGLVCNEIQQAVALKARIEQERDCIARLEEAVRTRNFKELNLYISRAVELGIDAMNLVKDAAALKAIMDSEERKKEQESANMERAAAARKQALEDARNQLVQAIASNDHSQLNAALQRALEQGLNNSHPDVAQAQAMLKNKDQLQDLRSRLDASCGILRLKSETGITSEDLMPLYNAIQASEQYATIPTMADTLNKARETYHLYRQHAQILQDLEAAVASRDRLKLSAAMSQAENLDMGIEIMVRAKDMLRDLESKHRAARAASSLPEETEPYDAAEEARKQRQEKAKQARFDVKNFPGLRGADDFARGAILNKGKVKELFLTFQSQVIPKSLLDLNKDNNKLAIQIFKDLLGYMGDKQMPFPAMLAQDILRKGYEYKPIRDEIFLQIIKQLTNNPRPESVAKGWQVMCMCVGTFPPSYDFENYLLHYILEKRDKGRGAVVDYARYCLRTLEAMLSNGDGTGFVPSVEEILAYKERPPILATIHLVDGNIVTEDLPLTPDLNVGKVLEMCIGWLDLKDPRANTLGIFVYDLGESEDANTLDETYRNAPYNDLVRTPRPLRNEDFMGDIIVQRARQRRKFKFVLKKKIFLPQHNERGSDPVYERLVYLQAEEETIIQGNIDIEDVERVVALASISIAVAFGEEMGGSVDELVQGAVVDFIVPAWRDLKLPVEWAGLVLANRDALVVADPEDLQDQFLQIVQESPLYGTHWFYVHKVDNPSSVTVPKTISNLPRDIILAFNADGMHVYSTNRVCLISFPYADIYRWGGSSSQFSLIMADESLADSFEFVVITGQAADMAAIILDHIRAIMAEQEAQED